MNYFEVNSTSNTQNKASRITGELVKGQGVLFHAKTFSLVYIFLNCIYFSLLILKYISYSMIIKGNGFGFNVHAQRTFEQLGKI